MPDTPAPPQISTLEANTIVSEAKAPEPVLPAQAGRFDALLDLWFAECVQNTPVARFTEAYNAIYAAKNELKRRLSKET